MTFSLLLWGCTTATTATTDPLPSPEPTEVLVSVQTVSDLAAAEAAFSDALQSGVPHVEIVLAAGSYTERSLMLEDEALTTAVTLRGEGTVVLSGVTILARSVTLSGLTFQGRHLLPLVQLEIRDHATVSDLHFTDAEARHPRGVPPLVDIVAVGPAAQAAVSGWVVEHSALPLLSLRVQPGGRFAAARLTDINATGAQGDAPAISAVPVDALTIDRVALPEGATLLAEPRPSGQVRIDGGDAIFEGPIE